MEFHFKRETTEINVDVKTGKVIVSVNQYTTIARVGSSTTKALPDADMDCPKCDEPMHLTTVLLPPYPDNLYRCDLCRITKNARSGAVLHCNDCQYDICPSCR